MYTSPIANVLSVGAPAWAAPKPANNGGIVPPWLRESDVIPLPGPCDDDFVILPIENPADLRPVL